MKKLILTLALLSIAGFTVADPLPLQSPPGAHKFFLNKVSFQLAADKWAVAQTAKVIVSINASMDEVKLAQIHGQIMKNLTKIAGQAEWHITQFQRSKNASGLEQLSAQAETRLPEGELAKLRENAKAVSQPGEDYQVISIDFTPSEAEIEKVKADLRQQIYDQVQAELARLNKTYPNANYFLHSINFNHQFFQPEAGMVMPTMMRMGVGSAPSFNVSNKIKMVANVVLAATIAGNK